MADGVISDYIASSDEITASDGSIKPSGLLDEVGLYNLYDDHDSPEQNAERILEITYPTETLMTVIQNCSKAVSEVTEFTEGGQVIGGEYGSGKSHIELVVYHLFNNPALGQQWLDQNGIEAELPDETQAAALQMFNLDGEYNRLSAAVSDYLGIDEWVESTDLPKVHEIRDRLEGQSTIVLIDEFERWFGMSERSDYEDDNLAFLQNLLEAAGRDESLPSLLEPVHVLGVQVLELPTDLG